MALVAREPELAIIAEVLDRAPDEARALVLVGPPGIGKTALWEEGVARGGARGMRVLAARASAAEMTVDTISRRARRRGWCRDPS